MAFSASPFERRSRASLRSTALGHRVRQRGFRMAPILNGLQPFKMAVHPCTARRLLEIDVFQLPATPTNESPEGERICLNPGF